MVTQALDVSVQAGVLNLLDALRRTHGLTYVLGGYVSAEAAARLYGVAVMTQGKIIEELSADDLRNQSAKTEYTRQLIQASRGKATA